MSDRHSTFDGSDGATKMTSGHGAMEWDRGSEKRIAGDASTRLRGRARPLEHRYVSLEHAHGRIAGSTPIWWYISIVRMLMPRAFG